MDEIIRTSHKLPQLCEYLLISLTFSYLTAAYYVTYHNSILTMPQLPKHKLSNDFAIALMQAILFGLSMIRPDAFLLFVGISLMTVFGRQLMVFRDLSEMFKRMEGQERRSEVDHHSERKLFQAMLEELNKKKRFNKCLDGWLPIKKEWWYLPFILIALGAVSELRHYYEWGREWLPRQLVGVAGGQLVIYLILFIFVWFSTGKVFVKGAEHPADDDNPKNLAIDSAAHEIAKSLRSQNSPSQSS